MRIGVLATILPPDPAGLGHTVWYKTRWLAARGVDAKVFALTPRGSYNRETEKRYSDPRVIRCDTYYRRGKRRVFHSIMDALRLAAAQRRELADREIVEFQGWGILNRAFLLSGLSARPLIQVFRGTDGWNYRPRARFLFDIRYTQNRSTHTLTNSRCLADHLVAKGLRVDGVIPSEVDPVAFAPQPQAAEQDRLVTVKSLYPVGGADILIEALGILQRRGVSFRHDIVGDGPLRPVLERRIRDLGLSDRVRLLGNVPHDAIPEILGRAAVKVLASRLESGPHVVGEAMMMGKPVVSTDTGGAKELLQHEETGLLARTGDPDDLAAKIERALRDHALREYLGKNAHRYAAANLSTDIVFGQYLDLYRRLLGA